MQYGYGRGFGGGFGRRGGAGFGFRGASPPWPYVGKGRGGLPRCMYPGAFAAPHYVPGSMPYPAYGGAWNPPFYGGYPAGGAADYSPPMTGEQEMNFLKEEANALGSQLEEINRRLKELEEKAD